MKLQQETSLPRNQVLMVEPMDIDSMAKAPASYITASNQASKANTTVSCCICKEEAFSP